MFRRTFEDASRGKLYSAREFNRLKNTVSELSGGPTRLQRDMWKVRHAITHDGGGTYPAFSTQPDTYAVKWVHLTYTAAAGKNSRTLTYWDGDSASPVNDTEGDDFVHNIARWGQSGDLYSPYIPEGTLIECYFQNGAWFTEFWNQTTMVRGTLTADMDASDLTASIDNLKIMNGAGLGGLTSLTFANTYGDAGTAGGIVTVVWNAHEEQWELLQLVC